MADEKSSSGGLFLEKLERYRTPVQAACRRAFRFVSAQISDRPYSWIGAALCCVLLIGLFLAVRKYFAIEERTITIGASAQNGKLRGLVINIEHKQRDELYLDFVVERQQPGELVVSTWTSDSLQMLVGKESHLAMKKLGSHSPRHSGLIYRSYQYQAVTDSPMHPGVAQTLAGSIIQSGARELRLRLVLILTANALSGNVTLTVSGLEGITVDSTTPNPALRNDRMLQFTLAPDDFKPGGVSEIDLRLTDRSASYGSDFRLFMCGILLGVCTSFLASIIYETMRERENALRSKRHSPPNAAPSPADDANQSRVGDTR
jgi:hypothetical protein